MLSGGREQTIIKERIFQGKIICNTSNQTIDKLVDVNLYATTRLIQHRIKPNLVYNI